MISISFWKGLKIVFFIAYEVLILVLYEIVNFFVLLGNTYGMCVLQDFEALTPNLLARTIETVEGGGAVVILLKVWYYW